MSESLIGVTVVGGYLGAGKTTLVNHVLRNADERVAVIVNDFGEISIDEDLIIASDGDKLTLANGCICCSLADGFAAALTTVRAAQPPAQRLLIEASGVADPAQIAAYGHTPGLRLDAVVVVADAETVRRRASDRWVADTVRMQLAAADLLVVNKIDLLVEPSDADELSSWLATIAPNAAQVRVRDAAVPLDVLFGPMDQATRPVSQSVAPSMGHSPDSSGAAVRSEPDRHTHAEDVFESQTVTLDNPIPRERIEALLDDLPDSVVRLKGFVRTTGASSGTDGDALGEIGDFVVGAVGARTSMTPSEPHRRWVISLIAYKGSLPAGWLDARLV